MFYIYIFAMTSVSQEDEFSEVTGKRKKPKAISSPTLPALQKPSSSEHPPETPVRPQPNLNPISAGGGGNPPPPGFSLAIATKINRSTPTFLTFNFYYRDII